MGCGAQSPRHPELLPGQDSLQTGGGKDGQQAAGGGIKNRTEISGEHRPQKDPAGKHRRALTGADSENGEYGDNVGKADFHAGNGNNGGDLGFHQEDGQGDGCQQPQKSRLFHFHPIHRLSIIKESLNKSSAAEPKASAAGACRLHQSFPKHIRFCRIRQIGISGNPSGTEP